MSMVMSAIWLFQFFLSGLSLVLVTVLGLLGVGLLVTAYFMFPHVQVRFQQFMASENNLSFQVKKSLEAFQNGNLFGMGPGEGVVKMHIPDAHTDFILRWLPRNTVCCCVWLSLHYMLVLWCGRC